jgi:hypothetical protein
MFVSELLSGHADAVAKADRTALRLLHGPEYGKAQRSITTNVNVTSSNKTCVYA